MGKNKSSGSSIEIVEESFRKKQFSPLYLFHGDEDFLIDQTIDLLMKVGVDESTRSFNLDIVYGSDIDAKSIVSLVSQFPMMAERRIVIVKEFDRISNKDLLMTIVEQPVSSTVAVFVAAKPDFRLKIYKAIQQHATVVEYKQFYESNIPTWIIARVKMLGKTITVEAAQLIQAHVGRSLREIQNEIDKLFIYVGDKQTIDVNDVNDAVGMSKQFNIFELQKKIGQKSLSAALEIAEHMLDSGESAIGIIVMLTRYFQKIWLLQELQPQISNDYQLASAVGVNAFFLNDYRTAARDFDAKAIEKIFHALLETDQQLKLSGDPKLLLTVLMHTIVNQVGISIGIGEPLVL